MAPVAIRLCKSVADFERMMELQQQVWGYAPIDVVPSHMFVVAAESGGQVLGAFLGENLVGFTLAYAGEKKGKPYLHSHFAAVLPQYRDAGIGRQLKIAQRELALARGIDRIEWTFDPLQARNAYFNICRLGAICRRYLPDLYGTTSSPLHNRLPTDRLLMEWHLDSPRVHAVIQGQTPILEANESISIPLDCSASAELQAPLRERFTHLFRHNYTVTWFERDHQTGRYLLTSSGDEASS